jgi:release factor glutamine methyltransferase
LKKSGTRAIIESLAQPLYRIYSNSLRTWEYEGLNVLVMPGIFHPGWFITSRMLLDRLSRTELKGRRFLELGCGTGTQACLAAKKGAISYASDVTGLACKNATLNAERNGLKVGVFQSDIFDQMDGADPFHTIFVNPPFIAQYPESERDFAFFCGEQYEYYIALFEKLARFLTDDGELIMALAKSCDYERILEIAELENFQFKRIDQSRKWAETNYLFSFTKPLSSAER